MMVACVQLNDKLFVYSYLCDMIWMRIKCVYVPAVNKLNISFDVIKGVGFINIRLSHDLNGRNCVGVFI